MTEELIKKSCLCAKNGMNNNEGGPFGAVITNSNGEVIATGNNRVLIDKDPTAHAEVIAIRNACQKLNTHDLTGLTIYSSCEPCPMCLSAIIWSNIKTVYYGATRKDAASIGFRDDAIYNFLDGTNKDLLNTNYVNNDECKKIFEDYKNKGKTLY